MAGYVPESMKEIQFFIIKSYADTVLNAFLLAPELLEIAPAGRKADIRDQISALKEIREKTLQDRQKVTALCEAAAVEGEMMLRYARKGRLEEEDILWLEEKAETVKTRASGSAFDEYILQGLNDLVSDIKAGRFTARAVTKRQEALDGRFVLGGYEWKMPEASPFTGFFSFVYSLPGNTDPSNIFNLQRKLYEIGQIKGVAECGYSILERLGRKAEEIGMPSGFMSVLMSPAYKKMAEADFRRGKSPKPMHKPIVLSGPPGVGKTAMLRDIADWTDTELFSFSMAQMDAASFGFPVYDPATGSAKRDILDDMKNTVIKPGVVLLDEMNRTGADIQSKLLTYLLDHKVSGFSVHPLSLVVGAENPISADPYGTMMKSVAMIDRCTYIDMSNYEMIANGWLEWVEKKYTPILQENELLAHFVRFLKENPPVGGRDIILKIPKNPENEPAFPTPRSIDASILSISVSGSDFDTALKILRANVGPEMANRFASYMDIVRAMPTARELVKKVKDVESVFAAIALDSIKEISKGSPKIVDFQDGLFNIINGYDDGKRKGKKVIDSFINQNRTDSPMYKLISSLTPETAKTKLENVIKDLYFSGSINLFEVGADSILSDTLIHEFRKSLRNSYENDEPLDSEYLNGLFKAACFFPVSSTGSYTIKQMEDSMLRVSWGVDDQENDRIEKWLCTAKIKSDRGIEQSNGDLVNTFLKTVYTAPWLTRVSKVFNQSTKSLERMFRDEEGTREIGI